LKRLEVRLTRQPGEERVVGQLAENLRVAFVDSHLLVYASAKAGVE